jgi:hypothetical protein
MDAEDSVMEQRLLALVADAAGLPTAALPLLELSVAEGLLQNLQRELRGERPPPPPVWRTRPTFETLDASDLIEVEPSDSEPPPALGAPRGADNREVRGPTRARATRPPSADRFDPIADAVSSAALNAEARRHEAPPPLPRISSSEVDIVLSEDDLIELDPTEEPPRRLTVAELLEEDPD